MLGQNTVSGIQDDETEAAEFFCDIYNGNLPEAFDDIGDELLGDLEDLTSFVEGLTTLAPEIFSDIIQGGEDVVSVVGELLTDPGDAITVIVGGIETAVEDIWGVFTNGLCDLGEIFGLCTPQSEVQASSIEDACYSSTAGYAAVAFTTQAAATTYYAAATTAQPAAVPTSPVASNTDAAAASTTTVFASSSGVRSVDFEYMKHVSWMFGALLFVGMVAFHC